jgi:hypothetical protein
MTRKIYKSAMGKTVDMGSLLLQNEQVRAVGNMNVNARGDRLNSKNQVIEPKNRQVQRQYNRQTNVSGGPADSGTVAVSRPAPDPTPAVDPVTGAVDTFADIPQDDPADIAPPTIPVQAQPETTPAPIPQGGLAAAMARSREVKQELEKTQRQKAQAQGVRKI